MRSCPGRPPSEWEKMENREKKEKRIRSFQLKSAIRKLGEKW